MPTVGARQRQIAERLSAAGIESAEHDAIVLMAYTFGWDETDVRLAIARDDHWPEDPLDFDLLEARVARREAREPLQHITGTAYFRDLTLEVGPGVFIPRPESETVAQVAIDAARDSARERGAPVRVADLCAGSGAIGLSIAHEVPEAHVSMVEASDEASVYLRLNMRARPDDERERIARHLADARACLRLFDHCQDVVVTNPPYIPTNAVPRDPEVRDFDPPQALYGLGDDGLRIPRAIIDEAARLLRDGGVLVLEHGEEQGAALRDYVARSVFWRDEHTRQDLTGRDRMLVAYRVGV